MITLEIEPDAGTSWLEPDTILATEPVPPGAYVIHMRWHSRGPGSIYLLFGRQKLRHDHDHPVIGEHEHISDRVVRLPRRLAMQVRVAHRGSHSLVTHLHIELHPSATVWDRLLGEDLL